MKFANYVKLFKIQGTGFSNIIATFISSQKDGLLKFAIFEFYTFPVFPELKKDKVFGKNNVTF